MAKKNNRPNAQQTFRQFAWNLAGTLASTRPAGKASAKPGGKR
tara:strand:+ start:2878 stop:3006 length:129 start_codon:yes stop_codon:yes gene_type:complete